jgi:ferritin-like metal-binding protein YciE
MEHYEGLPRGTLIAWAEKLGHDEVVRFLSIILNEGKAANTKQYHRASKGCQHHAIGRRQVFIGVPLMAR